MFKNTIISLLKTAVLVVVVVAGMVTYADWSAPPAAAPGCPGSTPGCNTPINVSADPQTKVGNLGVNALSISGGGAGAPSLVFNNYAGSPVSGPNKIKLFGDSNTLGFGIDASTLDYHSPSMHRWNIGSVIGAMTLNYSGGASNLNVNGNITASGDVKGGTRLCIGTDCRDRWPDAPGGGGGGAGDNLGNHIATQDLIMTSGNGAHDIKLAALVQAQTLQAQTANTSALNVTGPTSLNGTLTFNTVSGGLTESGRVLTAVNNSGLASWQPIHPRVATFGAFDSRRSQPPEHYTIPGSWDMCTVTSIYNDGGSDTGSPIGCELTSGGFGQRTWEIDVTGSQNDKTSCKVTCMKFPTDSDP
jgi:hypothetical protein